MIKLILGLLELSNFEGQSEVIDIAKGKNKLPLSIKEFIKYRKWQRK
jgi:hypothetical protein